MMFRLSIGMLLKRLAHPLALLYLIRDRRWTC